jgi:TetR/AcrR family transcriptional regulator, transcriptional repressor for nem operon
MRYGSDHKEKTHKKIVQVASKLFRSKGYAATGVDTVMKRASLTVGGFYAHFKSKENLLKEALEEALIVPRRAYVTGLEKLKNWEWLEAFLSRALSSHHRDHIEEGCPITALVSDFGRASSDLKQVYETEVLRSIELMSARMPMDAALSARQRALATMAVIIGGLNLARAVKSEELSNEILQSCKSLLVPKKPSRTKRERVNARQTNSVSTQRPS